MKTLFVGLRLPSALQRLVAITLGFVLIGIIGFLDYVTGIEWSFSIFYLIPISFAVWHIGWRTGLGFAAACGLVWLVNDTYFGKQVYKHPLTPYWNAIMDGGYFILVVYFLNRIREGMALHERISRERSELLAMASHEFGNHLAVFGTSLKLLEKADNDPTNRRQILETLERTYQVLNQGALNLLNFTRAENGKLQLRPRRMELRKLVTEALEAMSPLIRQKNIQVQQDFPQDIVPIEADPDAILLVMTNLIGNAIKYGRENGRLTVRLVVEPHGSEVLVSVEDTGIGIQMEDLKDLSLLFHRTEAGKGSAKGFGIGLRIVKDLLESHGTVLEISSDPGLGSRFYFRLPIWKETVPVSSAVTW